MEERYCILDLHALVFLGRDCPHDYTVDGSVGVLAAVENDLGISLGRQGEVHCLRTSDYLHVTAQF